MFVDAGAEHQEGEISFGLRRQGQDRFFKELYPGERGGERMERLLDVWKGEVELIFDGDQLPLITVLSLWDLPQQPRLQTIS